MNLFRKEKSVVETNKESSLIKTVGFIASSSGDANTAVVDVKNGKIVRIRPLHFDWKYR